MALTQQVKRELAAVVSPHQGVRRAEVAALLRFGGGLHLVAGRIVVEAELDSVAAARRLRTLLEELYSVTTELFVLNPSGVRRTMRYTIRVARDGETLARLVGLVDRHRRPVRGLPPSVVGGTLAEAVAIWRGAFLARGSLTEPGRAMSMDVTCPGAEAGLALVGAARRLGIQAKSRDVRGIERVVLRDGDDIAALLTRMGAQDTRLVWEERRHRKEVRAQANRLNNFDDANLRRAVRAAVEASARVERALEILGADVPEHLLSAGLLRMANRQVSLEELGQMHEPPLTKDAISGRIRRLLFIADRAADGLGIPNTEAALQSGTRFDH